jgi:hypothetical protein
VPSIRAEVIDGLGPALDAAMPRIRARAERILEASGLRMAGRVQQLLKARQIYDTGELRKSVTSRVTDDGTALVAIVTANQKYAEAVHEGRGPGKPPPVSVLVEWVLRKARQGRFSLDAKPGAQYARGPKKGRRKPVKQQREQAARSIAFAVQAKIAKRGIKPRRYFDDTFDLDGPREQALVSRQLAEAIRQEVAGGPA